MCGILDCIQTMSKRRITYVNPNDKSWTNHRFVLWFGACGPTFLLVGKLRSLDVRSLVKLSPHVGVSLGEV